MDGAVTLTARDAWVMSHARRVSAFDLLVMRRLARIDSPALDLVLPRPSQLADYGSLWIAVAAALWVTGGREARRAAWRGVGSQLLASATANPARPGPGAPAPPRSHRDPRGPAAIAPGDVRSGSTSGWQPRSARGPWPSGSPTPGYGEFGWRWA
jgi:hypothetical protein